MKGTLKYNIDPLSLKTEDEIWEVMSMIEIDYLPKANKKGIEMMVTFLLIFLRLMKMVQISL